MRLITILTNIAMLCCAVTLTGCATSAPQYKHYTLDMQPHAQLTAPVQFVALRMNVNQALQRPEILIRTSPTQIEYYALDRWASGLDEQIAEKLRTEFATPVLDVRRINADCTVMAFEQVDVNGGAEVRAKLEFVVDSLGFQKAYTQQVPAAASNAPAVVEALSRATEAIAAELSNDLAATIAANPEN